MLQLACAVFKSEAAAVTLMGKDRYFVSGGVGGCCKQIGQDVPWLSAMCGYTLTPQHHEVLVVEDMLADARSARCTCPCMAKLLSHQLKCCQL